jgi:hypothetical protein
MGPTKCLQDAADAFDAARSHLEHLENVADYHLQVENSRDAHNT